MQVLLDSLPRLQKLAAETDVNTEDASRRAEAFGTAFQAHLQRLKNEPASYGRLGLADLLELREECLREFHFMDVYRPMKESENSTALEVLPDLFQYLDQLEPATRFLALVEVCHARTPITWLDNRVQAVFLAYSSPVRCSTGVAGCASREHLRLGGQVMRGLVSERHHLGDLSAGTP